MAEPFAQEARAGSPEGRARFEPKGENAIRGSTSMARSDPGPPDAYFAMRFAAAIASLTPDLTRIALISFLAAFDNCRIAPRY